MWRETQPCWDCPGSSRWGRTSPIRSTPATIIPFRVPLLDAVLGGHGAVPVSMEIYNALGQKVRTLIDEDRIPGYYRIAWNGLDGNGHPAASGLYFYQLKAGALQRVKKMTLVK